MQEDRDRCPEDRTTRHRKGKEGNTFLWNLPCNDLFLGQKRWAHRGLRKEEKRVKG
jgi:hypothetical protein